jgi:hypothetical protein
VRHRLAVAASVFSILLVAASPGLAETPDTHDAAPSAASASAGSVGSEQRARDLYDLGARQYEQGAYADAVRAFRSAYDLTPVPALLYNLAQAERLAGDCPGALRDYRAFEGAHVDPVPPDLAGKAEEMERCVRSSKDRQKKPENADRAATAVDARSSTERLPADHGTLRALAYGAGAGAVTAGVLGVVFAVRMNASKERLSEVNQSGRQWGAGYSSEEQSWEHSRNAMVGSFVASGLLAGATAWLFIAAREKTSGNGRTALFLDTGPGRASATAFVRF